MKYLRDEEGIKQFGKRLKELRQATGISQQTLAHKVGLEQSQIGRIERGVVNTSISHAILIAKGLGIQPYELFVFPEVKNKKVK